MGVYIKGMEIPQDCFDCSTKVDPDNRKCNIDGHVFEETLGKLTRHRDEDCPLVPVPPHGKLIDASESIRVELYDEEHEDWTWHDMTIDDLLSQSWVDADAPTIIPAEEET